jgi:hypothetical protein
LGNSIWLYDGTTTTIVSPTTSEYTATDGYRRTSEVYFNQTGQVAGVSNRYNGNSDLGLSSWVYNGTTTRTIGLTDAEHTRNNGSRVSVSAIAQYFRTAAGTG